MRGVRIGVRARVGGARARVITRLGIELFVLAALITAACAWTAIALVDETIRKQQRDELQGLLDGAQGSLAALEEQVQASVEALAKSLLAQPELLERFLREQPDLRDTAGFLMGGQKLTYLDILTPEGKVLSSGHQAERIGLIDDLYNEIPVERPVVRRVKVPGGTRTAVVFRYDLSVGIRQLVLVGGHELDRDFVEAIAGHQAALLLVSATNGDVEATASSRATGLQPAAIWENLEHAVATPVRYVATNGSSWLLNDVELPGNGEANRYRLVVAVDRTGVLRLRRQLLAAFVLLGIGVAALAAIAGVWIARRTSRPIRDLVRAFDAIARGEADYSFNARAPDEIQELVTSFSHLNRALEHQRRRSMANERVAAWREVARHVAHEVKNPLAPIRLTVENLLRARGQAPERFDSMFREGMQTILDEVQQLSRMVSEFAEFARLPLPKPQPVDLEALVDRVVELYGSEPGVTIRKSVESDLPPVQLDADQLSRALKNVVGNAIEAAREGASSSESQPTVDIGVSIAYEMIQIVIADNGPGFSGEAERRLFEPYFTTKEHGTGLGMALTYRVIIEHGGVIFAENRAEGGAKVVIRLPLEPPDRRANHSRIEAWE